MIKVNRAKIEISGELDIILSELTMIIKALNEKTPTEKRDIEYAIKLGFMTENELKKENMKQKKERKRAEKEMKKVLEDLLGGIINDI